MIVKGSKVKWKLAGRSFQGRVCKRVKPGDPVNKEYIQAMAKDAGLVMYVKDHDDLLHGARDHESYIVRVERTDSDGAYLFPMLYRPPVQLLNLVREEKTIEDEARIAMEALSSADADFFIIRIPWDMVVSHKEVEFLRKALKDHLGEGKNAIIFQNSMDGRIDVMSNSIKDCAFLVIQDDSIDPAQENEIRMRVKNVAPSLEVIFTGSQGVMFGETLEQVANRVRQHGYTVLDPDGDLLPHQKLRVRFRTELVAKELRNLGYEVTAPEQS